MSRQCPNHYAFRAGQNLPDKEFRYLRTVIVTAAVHWGLVSMLHIYYAYISTWPSSTGQASAPILHLSILQKPVFLLNSCLDHFSAANLRWLPLSLSYGVNLPSSLTMLLSLTWKFSFFLPVSVYGTSTYTLLFGFSCHSIWILRYYFHSIFRYELFHLLAYSLTMRPLIFNTYQ